MAKKIVRLTESDMNKLVKRIVKENTDNPIIKEIMKDFEVKIKDRQVLSNLNNFLNDMARDGISKNNPGSKWDQARQYYKVEQYVPSSETIRMISKYLSL